MNEEYARNRLTDICKLLYDRQLTVSAGGNMSIRLNEREILITPSGRNKGMLEPEDLIKMDLDGNVLSSGKPSIEHKFHLALYRKNPDTNAVVPVTPLYEYVGRANKDIKADHPRRAMLSAMFHDQICTPGSRNSLTRSKNTQNTKDAHSKHGHHQERTWKRPTTNGELESRQSSTARGNGKEPPGSRDREIKRSEYARNGSASPRGERTNR